MRALCCGGLASNAPAQGVNSAPAEGELQTHQRTERPWGERRGKTTTDRFDLDRFLLPRSVDELINEGKEKKREKEKCAGLRCRSLGLIFFCNTPRLRGRRERDVYVEVWTQVQVIDAL